MDGFINQDYTMASVCVLNGIFIVLLVHNTYIYMARGTVKKKKIILLVRYTDEFIIIILFFRE